jgi:ABC-2 type transport system permease protein
VVSQEFHHAALRVSLAAVPRRGLFYAGKIAVIGTAALIVGLLTTALSLLLGQLLIGNSGIGVMNDGAIRAVVSTAGMPD